MMVTFTVTGNASDTEQIQLTQGIINNYDTLLLYERQLTDSLTPDDVLAGKIDWTTMTSAQKTAFIHDYLVLDTKGWKWVAKKFLGLSEN